MTAQCLNHTSGNKEHDEASQSHGMALWDHLAQAVMAQLCSWEENFQCGETIRRPLQPSGVWSKWRIGLGRALSNRAHPTPSSSHSQANSVKHQSGSSTTMKQKRIPKPPLQSSCILLLGEVLPPPQKTKPRWRKTYGQMMSEWKECRKK